MDEKEDDLNCMFDDFYFNPDKQGRELRRRSSIHESRDLVQGPIRWIFGKFPCHTSAEEQGVKLITEASQKVIGSNSRDGFIRTTLLLRSLMPGFSSKSYFKILKEIEGREHLSTLSFIDDQELAVSKENCVVSCISFLEAEKENLGIVAKYSAPEIRNKKTSSEHNSNYTDTSKNLECSQNVQKNLPTKITPSTVSSFVCDPEQFPNKTRATVDDMDITCLPSSRAESYPVEMNNKTRIIVNDMEITCVTGNNSFDGNSPSSPLNDVFLPESTFTSYDEDENNQLILGKLNMVAPVSKKELGLNSIIPALSFENIKLKSLSSSNSENANLRRGFLANTDSSFLNTISKKHPINISVGLIEEENFKLPSTVKGTKTNFSEISTYEHTGMDVSRTGSHVHEKENFTFDENSHYSQNSTHGVKFMKMFSEENSQNRIQVFSSEKSRFPLSSTAFLEDKENVGCNRKRRSTEVSSSELTDVLINKGRHHLADVKPLCLNSENDTKTSRDVSNHATHHSESYLFKEANKPLSTHGTNAFPANAMDIISKSREISVNLENDCNYLSEGLKFKDQKYEHPLFDQKSSAESLKAPQFEYEGMDLTSIADNHDFHFIDGDSFEEKQQKESGKNLNMDNSFALTGIGRTCHYTSDKMELTCASKCNIELKEGSSNSSLDNIDEYRSATMSESNSRPFHKDTQPKNSRIHHLTCVEKENIPLSSKHNESNEESQFKKYANFQADTSLNNYQNDKEDVMNQTLISHEMQFTCTFKTSVASPFLNLRSAYPTQPTESSSPDFKTLPLNSDDDSNVEKDPSNFSKPFFFKERDNSLLVKENYIFQSNARDITCNTKSTAGNSFNFGNNKNYSPTEHGKFGDMSTESSLHSKLSLMENLKIQRFDSEGMELTCVASNDEFPSINDDSFEVKVQKEPVNDLNLDHNLKLSDSSRTHHFTSDKMELTCAVKNYTELKKMMINDESCLNSHHKNLSTSESNQHQDETGSQSDQPNSLHSLDVGKKNMILNSMVREKQYKNCHSVEAFTGDCKSLGLVDGNNLSFPQNVGDKCADKTFNSHEMELTLMADKSHKLQVSPFFHLSSHSEGKSAFNFQNGDDTFYKKIQITQPYLSSLSKNIGEENPQESIPCNSPDNKILQTKQPSCLVSSEDNGNVWDVVLKPLNSKDATLKMPLGLKKLLSRTPGAVYTLRKKRQQIAKNFVKECILSPEVQNILKRSERFNLKKPFSEMKAYSPVSYDHKKSLTFHSFGMEGSFTAGLKENGQLPTVQPFNSSLKAINENSGMTSITSLIPAPTSAFTSFVRPEANLSCQSNKVALLEEKYTHNFSQIEDKQKSKNFSFQENDSLGILTNSFVLDTADSIECEMSEIFPSKILPEKSQLKNESSVVQSAKHDLQLPSETSDLNMDFEKNIYMKNSHGNLPLSISQNEIKLKDPVLRCESEALNLKTRCNDQNAIKNQDIPKDFTRTETDLKYNEVKNTFISEERKLKNVPLDSNSLDSQRVVDFNISEGSDLESTKNMNLSEMKVHDLQKTNDPFVLEKTTIKDKISDLSGYMSKFEVADLQETSDAFISKMAVNENEVSEQSENKTSLKTAISNFGNLPEIKTSSSCEKNSPEETALKTDSPKQSKDVNIQNIAVDHSAKHDTELNSDGNELKSSSNEISNLRNFCTNPYNQIVSLSGNSPCKTNNQKNSDPKSSLNGVEINDVIWRAPNLNESVKRATLLCKLMGFIVAIINGSANVQNGSDLLLLSNISSMLFQTIPATQSFYDEALVLLDIYGPCSQNATTSLIKIMSSLSNLMIYCGSLRSPVVPKPVT
ncbi:hypothetical protein AVEN_43632-1 [Araneus ventricosus]|uniref:Uncharacterized protein n=1 Tax=Araneus ventricosus TaxID=182803 RepID=A0A4Y2FG01_ARAVE|nr:hypothetical protein AVEN_43632-1 [Araneus ventricosus]